jgi:hypothetical protein
LFLWGQFLINLNIYKLECGLNSSVLPILEPTFALILLNHIIRKVSYFDFSISLKFKILEYRFPYCYLTLWKNYLSFLFYLIMIRKTLENRQAFSKLDDLFAKESFESIMFFNFKLKEMGFICLGSAL